MLYWILTNNTTVFLLQRSVIYFTYNNTDDRSVFELATNKKELYQ